jgi:hypothetical protein
VGAEIHFEESPELEYDLDDEVLASEIGDAVLYLVTFT